MDGPRVVEDEAIMVSALAHYSYCPRRCALIHCEQEFDENLFTLRGSMAHVRADEPTERTEEGVTVERALPIWCERLGLFGRADVVEFYPDGKIVPVEYKHGPKRRSVHDELQLCAQAMCLEEMFGRPVPLGAVYSSSSHQRREVELGNELRQRTLAALELVRAMLGEKRLPPPVNDSRCPNCSLVHVCMPSGVSDLVPLDSVRVIFSPTDSEVAE